MVTQRPQLAPHSYQFGFTAFNRPLKVCCGIRYQHLSCSSFKPFKSQGGGGWSPWIGPICAALRTDAWQEWDPEIGGLPMHPGPLCFPGNWHTHSSMDIKAKPGHHRTWSPSSFTLWSSFDVVVVLTFSEVLGSVWASYPGGNTVAPRTQQIRMHCVIQHISIKRRRTLEEYWAFQTRTSPLSSHRTPTSAINVSTQRNV